jgi:hypothetical protein
MFELNLDVFELRLLDNSSFQFEVGICIGGESE